MPPKRTVSSKRSAPTPIASMSTEPNKRPKRVTRPPQNGYIVESPEPEITVQSTDTFDHADSIETRFQDMDVRLQANEHSLTELSTGMAEVLRILKQPTQPTYQEFAYPATSSSNAPHVLPLQAPTPHLHLSQLTPALGNPGNSPYPQADRLSRWKWVDTSTVESIVNGTFDLNNLPKLFREYADRQAHTIATTNGMHLPADGTQPYVVITKIKLLSAFPSLSRFLSAWSIYCSIRTAYKPEYATGLYAWQERVIHRARIHKDWSDTLNYIIKYFDLYQSAPPDAWFYTDPELIADCFVSGEKSLETAFKSGKRSDNSKHLDICRNWNDSKCIIKEKMGRDCLRQHICYHCQSHEHRAPNCPSKSTKPTAFKPSSS